MPLLSFAALTRPSSQVKRPYVTIPLIQQPTAFLRPLSPTLDVTPRRARRRFVCWSAILPLQSPRG